MKRILAPILALVLLCGCTAKPIDTKTQYTATFLELFDTVTTIVGRADSEEEFTLAANKIRDELEVYHRLFDIYNEYDGIANLCTLNLHAAESPIEVDDAIIDLLEDCKEYYTVTDGLFNPAMGSVLSLWHVAREDGLNNPESAYLPDSDALKKAAEHVNPDDIIIDREKSTVYFADPELKLDVGAIAKGWSVERICETAPSGLLLSVGGNVCATGPKDEKGASWSVGIRNPSGDDDYLHIVKITDGCVVTSGSYMRAYVVDGKLYHHIIDPRTLHPSELWTSVSIVCADSGIADMLSTTLFLLDLESGQELLDKYDAEALWVDPEGNKFYSPGFKKLIK